MNLTIERGPAAAALSRAFGIVEKRHTIDILANVVLTAADGRLTLRTTDLNMEVIETISADVATPGEITVPADKLHDIVHNADTGAQIALALADEDQRMRVRAGRSNYKVPTREAADFPKFPSEDFTGGFTISAPVLADMLSRSAWGVSRDSNGKNIENLYLARIGEALHATGCTHFGVSLRRETAPGGSEGLRAMLPMKVINQALKWLSGAEGDIKVSFLNRNEGRPTDILRLESASGCFTSRLFDGAVAFVPYLEVLTEEHDLVARVDQDALKTAIRRVLIMKDAKSDTLKLTFTPEAVTLQMRNDQSGEGAEEIACDYDGPEAIVLLSARILSDSLASLQGDTVEIGFGPEALDPPTPGASQDERAAYMKSVKVFVRAPVDPSYVATLCQMRV